MKTKYNIGDKVYYIESGIHRQRKIPCPICFGKREVVIILGDGARQTSECDYCKSGFSGPTGQIDSYDAYAELYQGTIIGIEIGEGTRYRVDYSTFKEHELFLDKDEAEKERQKRDDYEKERAAKWFQDSFIQAKKKQTWSVGYHKRCIKDAERTIEWHKLRLAMIKEKEEESDEPN